MGTASEDQTLVAASAERGQDCRSFCRFVAFHGGCTRTFEQTPCRNGSKRSGPNPASRYSALVATSSIALLILLFHAPAYALEPLSFIRVSDDHRGFVLAESGKTFRPWGVNYDHDERGRLIEDYWDNEWEKVEADFREIRDLGANAVRIHLQFGKFMQDAHTANKSALSKLAQLARLAEELGLYLNLTGLACYHKPDVPPWYDGLDEAARWQSQAAFWEAIAKTCQDSPAIFCYDLMNEPVVPGAGHRDDWLGPPFGDKYFVQFITLDLEDRERPDVARAWIEMLSKAIRQHDQRHLITVGLVDWSLDRPGLTSGFVPQRIAEPLDFLSVHIYPQSGELDRAIETLQGFAEAGHKPVVIEEMFPLRCTAEELETFIRRSRSAAAGWFGFYWGKTIEESQASSEVVDAIAVQWLELFRRFAREMNVP